MRWKPTSPDDQGVKRIRIIVLAQFVEGETTFGKRTARGKTLLQKGFPPGPPFPKLPNDCDEALVRRRGRLSLTRA